MKVIREHSDLLKSFPEYFGVESSKEMKFSYFTYFQKVTDEKIILYSFISNAIILLNRDEYEAISNGNFIEESQLYSTLQKKGFFVKKDVDENAILARQRAAMQNAPSETLKAVILPTTNCNAGCHYCIAQKNVRMDMTIETAKATIEFIAKKAEGYKNVSFNWYGGEPLLKHDLITMMCRDFQSRMPNVGYSSVITTNLVLFDDAVLDSAVNDWRIRKINITLDGTEQEHNSRKKYIDRAFNGYQKTMHYIGQLLEKGVAVFCRFNVDKNNIGELSSILQDIKAFLSNELFHFYIASLRSESNIGDFYTILEANEMAYTTNSLMIENGVVPTIDSLVPKLLTGFCLAKSKHSLVIGADGSIYRCNECSLDKTKATGSISKGVECNEAYDYFMSINLPNECNECRFLPICQGGCPERRENISATNSPCNRFKFKVEAISKILVEHYIDSSDSKI